MLLMSEDGQYLVRRSIESGEPILVVGLNYRLGVLGFLRLKSSGTKHALVEKLASIIWGFTIKELFFNG